MKLEHLISRLLELRTRRRMSGDAEVDLLVEVLDPQPCQYQYPVQDIAYSVADNRVILLHEKFNGEDQEKKEHA